MNFVDLLLSEEKQYIHSVNHTGGQNGNGIIINEDTFEKQRELYEKLLLSKDDLLEAKNALLHSKEEEIKTLKEKMKGN